MYVLVVVLLGEVGEFFGFDVFCLGLCCSFVGRFYHNVY